MSNGPNQPHPTDPHWVDGETAAMAERRSVEATLREVLENAQGASYKRNLLTNAYEYLSPIFTVLTGRTVEAVKSIPLEEIIQLMHPDDVPEVEAKVAAALQCHELGHFRVDYRFRHLDGHYLWFRDEFKIIYGDGGCPLAMVGCVSDITASKAVEDELHQSQANLEALVESTSDLIWSVDRNYALTLFNSALAKHFATSYGTLARKGVGADVLLPEGRTAKWPSLYERAFQVGPFLQEMDLEDGRVLELTFHPIRHGDAIVGASVFGKDVTERRLAEQARNRLQAEVDHLHKLESLGQLAGGVAHDMNNVLGAILALASAHLVMQPKDSPTYPAFETIRDAAMRGGDMVKRLLTFARQDPVEMRELDPNALLLEVARILERTTLARVRLETDLAPDLRSIRGDGSALINVLMNISINAVDAISDGGTITFRTRNVHEDQVEVAIQDTGSGMTREVLAKAMDPFFTTKEVGKGTGLGLSMAFTIVKAHGGQLELESAPGKGTRVRLLFPAMVTKDLRPAATPPAPIQPVKTAMDVLLIDDDDLIQKSTRMLVEALGHAVTLAPSGEVALALLEQGFQPDAVILDMNMPGLGGKATLPRLRGLCPTVPVLLATGRVDQEALDLVAAHPFVTLMSKPFSYEELRGHLHQGAGS